MERWPMNVYKAFQILELKYYSTEKEVKQRYKELVKQYHPDVCNWDSTAKFQEIQEAYETVIEHICNNKAKYREYWQSQKSANPPVKKDMRKKTAAYTRDNNSATKTTKKSSNIGGWLIIAGVCLFLLILMVPGMQLIVLLLLLYGVTRILK